MNINAKTEDVFRNKVPLLLCPVDVREISENRACRELCAYQIGTQGARLVKLG